MRAKDPKAYDALDTMRHSAAHLLAAAVMRLYPDAKLGVGPVVENGFYYDILLRKPLGPEDLRALEKTMAKIRKEGEDFRREEMSIDEAVEFFRERGQDLKAELLKDLKERGTTNLKDEDAQDVDAEKPNTASVYWTGDFVDLCRGPHVKNVKDIGAVRLTTVAGAYWRGKEGNPQLQRVYGLAFATEEELERHLKMLEEAKERDHRKIGREQGLFVFSELVGPGLPLWTPRGTLVREALNDYVWELRRPHGYQRVTIPHITKKDLYETSGHWAKFADDLFKIETREGRLFAMKPMNCPHHTQIYASEPRSYRDMPVRYAETTMVYRDEQSGELSGLSRVLSITQDDAHVFCRMGQVREEAEKIWSIIETFYKSFGFELSLRLSRRDPAHPEKYLGEAADWESAEASLREILEARGAEYADGPGEAAFYGPKIDFMAEDSLGRVWQVATIQLDFNQPRGFDLSCVNEKGEKERIVMIHCAIMGSIERFLAVLIEHLSGNFPAWMAPEQVALLSVADRHIEACRSLKEKLAGRGIRVFLDDGNDSVGKKIRNAVKMKVPYLLVIGDKEAPEGGKWSDASPVAVRARGEQEAEAAALGDFIAKLEEEVRTKKR